MAKTVNYFLMIPEEAAKEKCTVTLLIVRNRILASPRVERSLFLSSGAAISIGWKDLPFQYRKSDVGLFNGRWTLNRTARTSLRTG